MREKRQSDGAPGENQEPRKPLTKNLARDSGNQRHASDTARGKRCLTSGVSGERSESTARRG